MESKATYFGKPFCFISRHSSYYSSAVALRDLESTPQPHPHIACAYFFFGYFVNPHSNRILTHALGSIIYSLVSRSMPPYPPAVTRLGVSYAQNSSQGSTVPYDEGQSCPSDQELVDALKSIAQAFDAVYLLLDSIDECSSSSGILKLVQSSREWNTGKIHILVTSCPTPKSLMELQGSINDEVVVGDASFDEVGFLISQLNDMEARTSPLIHWLLAWICVSVSNYAFCSIWGS
jgi:hypothetical protein